MATTKAQDLIAGLTPAERDELLAELKATPASEHTRRELTPRERVIATLLRGRDHLEGCPIHRDKALAAARVEGYDETIIAPSRIARNMGLGQGDTMAVVRCLECSGVRYLEGPLDELLVKRLEGADQDDDELDSTLE